MSAENERDHCKEECTNNRSKKNTKRMKTAFEEVEAKQKEESTSK